MGEREGVWRDFRRERQGKASQFARNIVVASVRGSAATYRQVGLDSSSENGSEECIEFIDAAGAPGSRGSDSESGTIHGPVAGSPRRIQDTLKLRRVRKAAARRVGCYWQTSCQWHRPVAGPRLLVRFYESPRSARSTSVDQWSQSSSARTSGIATAAAIVPAVRYGCSQIHPFKPRLE